MDTWDWDMSHEQMMQLLDEAEARLRQKDSTTPSRSTSFKIPKVQASTPDDPYTTVEDGIVRVSSSKMADPAARVAAMGGARKVEDPLLVKKRAKEAKKATAGPMWYNLPRTDLTPETKRDFQLLKMRNALDSKRFYKKEGGKAEAPEFSQIGTIIEGPTEFYSSRLNNKDRKRTFAEEILASEKQDRKLKRKYEEIQESKASGKKGYYKALREKRKSRRG